MAGLFGALDLSARALGVTQRGLGVTAHNIANVNTAGYTRQRQVLESALPVNDAAGAIGGSLLSNGLRLSALGRLSRSVGRYGRAHGRSGFRLHCSG